MRILPAVVSNNTSVLFVCDQEVKSDKWKVKSTNRNLRIVIIFIDYYFSPAEIKEIKETIMVTQKFTEITESAFATGCAQMSEAKISFISLIAAGQLASV